MCTSNTDDSQEAQPLKEQVSTLRRIQQLKEQKLRKIRLDTLDNIESARNITSHKVNQSIQHIYGLDAQHSRVNKGADRQMFSVATTNAPARSSRAMPGKFQSMLPLPATKRQKQEVPGLRRHEPMANMRGKWSRSRRDINKSVVIDQNHVFGNLVDNYSTVTRTQRQIT